MKNFLTILMCVVLLGLNENLCAQMNFESIKEVPFEGLRDADIAQADVNGDGYTDVLVIGQNNDFEEVTKLYLNHSDGKYSEVVNAPFVSVELGAAAFKDVNNNGREDLLISGLTSAGQPVTKLYINTGEGNFVEDTTNSFEGVYYSAVAFADLDANGSEELIITGLNADYKPVTNLYVNDGSGNFNKKENTVLESVYSGNLVFGDVNGNTFQDIILTGKNANGEPVSNLYINDGKGNFNKTDAPFVNVIHSDVVLKDFNGNGNLDVVISGFSDQPVTKFYANMGNAEFKEMDTPLVGVGLSSILTADVDGNGSLDLIICGNDSPKSRLTKIYTNDGTGIFTAGKSLAFDDLNLNCMEILQSKDHQDFIMFGQSNSGLAVANLYRQ